MGLRVLWFERDEGWFTRPSGWTRDAVAMTSTHDLATVAGWWSNADLDWRASLGLLKDEPRERAQRAEDRTALWNAFRDSGAAEGDPPPPDEPARAVDAAITHTGRAACELVLIPVEDALAMREQPNLPGTLDEHPNWRRRLPDTADRVLDEQADRRAAQRFGRSEKERMSALRATARLQFHKDFTLDHALDLVPYFRDLGISHVYASPLLKSRPGSTHGYDIVDHHAIDPELGGEPALRRLVEELRRHEMGLILDIVPNHMGVGGADNAWWLDVLEWGRASPYAEYFDIDWEPPDATLRGRLLAPFLGNAYGEALEAGDLVLKFDAEDGRFYVSAYDTHRFPIDPRQVRLGAPGGRGGFRRPRTPIQCDRSRLRRARGNAPPRAGGPVGASPGCRGALRRDRGSAARFRGR